MKTMLIAAAVAALAAASISALMGQADAARLDPYCTMGEAANQSWAEHYHCWGGHPPRVARVAARAAVARPDTSYCKNALHANDQSWAEYYHCWHR